MADLETSAPQSRHCQRRSGRSTVSVLRTAGEERRQRSFAIGDADCAPLAWCSKSAGFGAWFEPDCPYEFKWKTQTQQVASTRIARYRFGGELADFRDQTWGSTPINVRAQRSRTPPTSHEKYSFKFDRHRPSRPATADHKLRIRRQAKFPRSLQSQREYPTYQYESLCDVVRGHRLAHATCGTGKRPDPVSDRNASVRTVPTERV